MIKLFKNLFKKEEKIDSHKIIILGAENNSYEIMKKKADKLLELFKRLGYKI